MNNADDTTQSGSPLYRMPIDQQGVTDAPTFAPPRPTAADVPRDPGGPTIIQPQVGYPARRDFAQMLLGDAALEDQITLNGDVPYIDGVPLGPPARWAADPTRRL